MSRQTMTVLVVMGAGLLVGTGACVWPGHPVFWRSPESIERYLLSRTPLGSSLSEVVADLQDLGASRPYGEALNRIAADPLHDQRRGGLQVLLAEYRVVFVTSVSAIYWFDAGGGLVAIEVEKTTDTL
jgi:hypothetical protein